MVMSKVSREQPWSISSTIGKCPFVRMLQNCHENSSYLDKLGKALHFVSAFRGFKFIGCWYLCGNWQGQVCAEVRAGGIARCVLTSSPSEWGSGCTQLIIWTEIITEAQQSGSWEFLQFTGGRCIHNKISLILPDINLILNFQKRKKCLGKQMDLFTTSEIPFNLNNFKGFTI